MTPRPPTAANMDRHGATFLTMNDRAEWLLACHLEVAVPLEMLHLANLTPDDRADVAAAWAAAAVDLIANSDASLLYPIKGHPATDRHCAEPGTAATFAATAKGIAAAAYAPGGITAFGRHWCANHAVCQAAEAEAKDRRIGDAA
jgi:hypothetical protein